MMILTPATALLLTTALALAAPAAAGGRRLHPLVDHLQGRRRCCRRRSATSPARGPNCKGDNVSPRARRGRTSPEGTRSFAFVVFDPGRGLRSGYHPLGRLRDRARRDLVRRGRERASRATSMSAARAPRTFPASAAPARRRGRRTIICSRSSPPISTRRTCLPGLTFAELQEKLKGHRKGKSSLVGTYVNPYPP